MNKIGIVVHPEKDPGLKHLKYLVGLLREHCYEVSVSCGNYFSNQVFEFCSMEECFADSMLVLTLGGDGTLLRAAAYANKYDVPLLGVNLGHLGFLAELECDELELLPSILSNEFDYTERMMLRVSVINNGLVSNEFVALNDAVIRSKSGKPAQIVISDSEKDLLEYFCDGFIVATPTGSTAYSMSAGGPILEPQSNNIVVTPICPHTLGARSVVFDAAKQTLFVRVLNAERIEPVLECDGNAIKSLVDGDCVAITRHSTPLKLLKLSDKSFYKVLNEKISRRML
ncbi:MAG: NAD(+)/NADH kinase [Clostridia bacterium]|nr:NAD(+)/NADH kinase [Clostridia bacterium]